LAPFRTGSRWGQIVGAVESCCSQRYAKQAADPDWFKRENVNRNEGKHRQIPNVMNDSRESRMWFREDSPREQYDEVWTPPKSRLNSNEG